MLAIVAAGELSLPLSPSRRLQQVSLADLGTLVAALLERPGEFAGQRIEVAATSRLSARWQRHSAPPETGR